MLGHNLQFAVFTILIKLIMSSGWWRSLATLPPCYRGIKIRVNLVILRQIKCNVLLWNAQLFLFTQYWHSLVSSLMQFLSFTSMKVCCWGKGCMLSSISKQIYCGQSRRCRWRGVRPQSSQFVRLCSWQLHSQHAYWHYTHITSTVVSISIQKPIFDFPDWQGFLEHLRPVK